MDREATLSDGGPPFPVPPVSGCLLPLSLTHSVPVLSWPACEQQLSFLFIFSSLIMDKTEHLFLFCLLPFLCKVLSQTWR